MSAPRRAIVGVGNVLLGDEGVGVHAVRALLARDMDSDVLVLDGGTEGLGLMDVIVGLTRLVFIDCVRGGGAPGTVYCFDWDTTAAPRSPISAHQRSSHCKRVQQRSPPNQQPIPALSGSTHVQALVRRSWNR